ncbi:MAG: tRNA lysidine(34) synthetase TilS [Gemmataceae bacterium]|nr:tRNA lysidine(34) synthetase TilS [Gemmataceae bacterium]
MPRVRDAIRAFDRGHRLGPLPGVVAVSGGADSVALLRAFHQPGGRPLTVAHFDHGLRGAESDADAAFVAELAARLGLPFRFGRGDLRADEPGLEAAARRQRYDWLAGVVAEAGASWVATGHTADDQAETVLHRLLRGTGLHGLRGMEACRRRVVAGVSFLLLRPLLAVTRADVLDYLASLKQPYREDASNADPRFTRNRIRHELLPLLRTFNPDVAAALNRLAEQAAEAHDAMAGLARDFLVRAELPRAGDLVILDAVAIVSVPVPVLRTLLRLVWEREGWPTGDMTAGHWDWAAAVASSRAGGRDFPGGVSMRLAGRVVQVGRRS